MIFLLGKSANDSLKKFSFFFVVTPAITQQELRIANLCRKWSVLFFSSSTSIQSSDRIENPVENISGKITRSPDEMSISPKLLFARIIFSSGFSHSISFW